MPAVAELTVGRPDGTVEQLEVPAAGDVLELIHSQECAVLAVAEVVDIAVTDLHEEGDTLAGSLTLTRRTGDDPVTASRVERSVLIAGRRGAAPGDGRRRGDRSRARWRSSRRTASRTCSSETKKPFVFPLSVTVGDGDEVPVNLPLDQAARDQLTALVQRVCAAGLTGKRAGPAAPGGTGQPGRGRDRRALARRADDSAAGWQGDAARPPDRSVMTVRNQRYSRDPLNGWTRLAAR